MIEQPDSLSVEQAAMRLGISGQTIRRRIKAGQLSARLVHGPKGKEWRLARVGALEDVGEVAGVLLPNPELADLAHLLREILHDNTVKTERIIALERELAATQERLLLTVPRKPWWKVLLRR